MKRLPQRRGWPAVRAPRCQEAFTLPELTVASFVFLLVVGGVIAAHVFGMRMLEPVNARQQAADEARRLMNTLVNDIRSARRVKIGTGTRTSFKEAGVNALQEGSALQVYATTNPNVYVRYFRDAATACLCRITNNSSEMTVMARAVATASPFALQDFQGRPLTNDQMNSVVSIKLRYSEVGADGTPARWSRFFKSYDWNTQVYRRTLQ